MVALIERCQQLMKMPFGIREEDLFDEEDMERDTHVDDIYISHAKKI